MTPADFPAALRLAARSEELEGIIQPAETCMSI